MTEWHYNHSGGGRGDLVAEGLTGLPEDLSLAPRTQLRASHPTQGIGLPHLPSVGMRILPQMHTYCYLTIPTRTFPSPGVKL